MKRNKEMHSFSQASLCSQGEISIILQQDFYSLRLEICPEIPTEVELFVPSSVCFLICFFFFFKKMQ